MDKLLLKTRVLIAIVILANVLGNFAMSWGLKRGGAPPGDSWPGYLQVFLNPWVLVGISLLVLWVLARMALLSWADLSYVLPVTAVGYVLNAVMGKVFLHEHVSAPRWFGTLLIVAGVALVDATSVRTTAASPAPEAPTPATGAPTAPEAEQDEVCLR